MQQYFSKEYTRMLLQFSYSPFMTVTAVILEIFSVKEYPDLENRVRVHSRSKIILDTAISRPTDLTTRGRMLACLRVLN